MFRVILCKLDLNLEKQFVAGFLIKILWSCREYNNPTITKTPYFSMKL